MKKGDVLICIEDKVLSKSGIKPPVIVGREYVAQEVILDSKDNLHIDVGLKSRFNYITSLETNEELPRSGPGEIHWCHPSRFKVKKQ